MIQVATLRACWRKFGVDAVRRLSVSSSVSQQSQEKPEKIEVFIDDKPVWVEPGTTVLQVSTKIYRELTLREKNQEFCGVNHSEQSLRILSA